MLPFLSLSVLLLLPLWYCSFYVLLPILVYLIENNVLCFIAFLSLFVRFVICWLFSHPFRFSISFFHNHFFFIRSRFFLLLITRQRYCYIKASQANGLTCTFWYVYSLFLNAHLAQYRWEFWWKCVFLSWIFDRFVPFKFALKHVPPASMTIRLFNGSVS